MGLCVLCLHLCLRVFGGGGVLPAATHTCAPHVAWHPSCPVALHQLLQVSWPPPGCEQALPFSPEPLPFAAPPLLLLPHPPVSQSLYSQTAGYKKHHF